MRSGELEQELQRIVIAHYQGVKGKRRKVWYSSAHKLHELVLAKDFARRLKSPVRSLALL
jgi:hypothetical protein